MSKVTPQNLIEESFAEFVDIVGNDQDATEQELESLRRTFFAGAMTVWELVDSCKGIQQLTATCYCLDRELQIFRAKVKQQVEAERAKQAKCAPS
jgi:hypothetical protein